jgi:hypothetical protein
MAMTRFVASICPRSEASSIAAVTTLLVGELGEPS